MARIVFLGTPQFAAPILESLIQAHEVVAVVTQPDRVAGRGRSRVNAPAVKAVAEAHALRVLQPDSLRRDRLAIGVLREAKADLFVLASFGQILPQKVLDIPRFGCLGVHASLLPLLRGAAPIPAAILHGCEQSGITLMLTDAGMDTGPIVAQRSLTLAPDETTGTLTERLSCLGAQLLLETIPQWLAGEITPRRQTESQATHAPPIDPAEGLLDWQRQAAELFRRVRAFTPWPGAYTYYRGKMLKIIKSHPCPHWRGESVVGTVVAAEDGLGVATGEGLLALDAVQLAGKKVLATSEFVRGQRGFVGSVLGKEAGG